MFFKLLVQIKFKRSINPFSTAFYILWKLLSILTFSAWPCWFSLIFRDLRLLLRFSWGPYKRWREWRLNCSAGYHLQLQLHCASSDQVWHHPYHLKTPDRKRSTRQLHFIFIFIQGKRNCFASKDFQLQIGKVNPETVQWNCFQSNCVT